MNNVSSSSLPSLPEHDIYRPNQYSCTAFFDKHLGPERSRKAAIGALFLITTIFLFSSVAAVQQQDRRRRLGLRRAPRTLLFDDGTLYANQGPGNDSICDYLTHDSKRHTDITSIHINFDEFNMEDYLGAKLIANAAQVPLIISGNNLGDAASRYATAAYRIGPIPVDHGMLWPVEHLCNRCTAPLCKDYIHLLHHVRVRSDHEDNRVHNER